jgi:hypothetical protein
MQLSCESIDVVFDRARPNSDGHANVSIVEPLGQKIENFDFSRPHVNRRGTLPRPVVLRLAHHLEHRQLTDFGYISTCTFAAFHPEYRTFSTN